MISDFPITVTIFRTVQKWVQCRPVELFTHNVKKINGAAHKKGDVNGTCKRAYKLLM